MLSLQITKETFKDLDHIIVEMKLKSSDAIFIRGLFLGIKPVTQKTSDIVSVKEPFVWVYRNKCVHIFCLKYYDIKAVEMSVSGKSKISNSSNYTDKKEDQEKAVEQLTKAQEVLAELDQIREDELIDISKYDNVPAYLNRESKNRLSQKTGSTGSQTSHNRSGGWCQNYGTGQGSTTHSYYKRKEVSTSNFKRTTRYDVKEALDHMKVKIAKLKKGTYQPPKLKKLAADAVGNSQQGADDGDDDGYPYHYGMI